MTELTRLNPIEVPVTPADKNSVGVFLDSDGEYFDSYTTDDYFMSPGCKYEKQCLYYGEFGKPEELLLELVSNFTTVEDVNYRGMDRKTSHI